MARTRYRYTLLFAALIAGCASSASSTSDSGAADAETTEETQTPFEMPVVEHVVIIGIDGMGGLFVEGPQTPTLDAIMLDGAYTLTMQNVLPTSSSSNWMSMLNGQGTDGHGVYSNGWSVGDSNPADTIVKLLNGYNPNATIGVFHDWGAFGRLVETGLADEQVDPGDEDATTAAAVDFIKNNQPQLTFIHLDHVDHAGHATGWFKDEEDCLVSSICRYVEAVEHADALVGEILQAIDDAGMTETTAVLISADHGGMLTGHGGDTYDERAIPFFLVGPGVRPGPIDRLTHIFDIPATAAALLGLAIPEAWVGQPVLDALDGYTLPKPSSSTLTYQLVTDYTGLYDDTGSGAANDLSIWRPVVPDGFHWLGDVAVANSREKPTFATPVVKGNETMLAPPVGYEQLWKDEGSGSASETAGVGISLWHGIAPVGYTCIGTIAIEGYDIAPTEDLIRCVHNDFITTGKREQIWNDRGSGADLDSAIWTCEADGEGALSTHTFISRRNNSDGGIDLCRSLKLSTLIEN